MIRITSQCFIRLYLNFSFVHKAERVGYSGSAAPPPPVATPQLGGMYICIPDGLHNNDLELVRYLRHKRSDLLHKPVYAALIARL